MIILYDLDGVGADLLGGIEEWMNQNHPSLGWHRGLVTEWNLFETIPHPAIRQKAEDHMLSPGFFLNLEPIIPALRAYSQLMQAGHEVIICTTPVWVLEKEAQSKKDKYQWVHNYFGLRAAESMIFSHDKTRNPADFIIDDRPDLTLGKSEILCGDWIIVDHPYNGNLPAMDHAPVARINSDWSNYREVFKQLGLI